MRQFLDKRKAIIELVAISFLSLFLELALIRFISSSVHVIAYFNNFLVLSAFLGLGFGSILSDKKYDPFQLSPIIFAGVITLVLVIGEFGSIVDYSENIIFAGSSTEYPNLPVPIIIILVFCSNFVFFIPLGVRLGQSLKKFENRLAAYAFDLFGSILGVVCFTIMSYLQTGPLVWFSISGIVTLFLLRENIKSRRFFLGVLYILIGIFATLALKGNWSPYYRITWESYHSYNENSNKFLGYAILVDNLRIQDALRFSDALANHPNLGTWIPYYRLPYQFRKPCKVLVLGGGSGNDTTMALQYGAERVDVVEIDPVIINLGYSLHPHRPYLDPRVRAINDDARSFLRKNKENYDLIIMNALDSHHQLAGLSTLRLESFIYTAEAFKDVRRHMDENSIFLIHLGSAREWMGQRLYWTLTEAFGAEPRLFTTSNSPFSSIAFVYGPEKILNHNRFPDVEKLIPLNPGPFHKVRENTVLATDDWPHLYLSKPKMPKIYLYVLVSIVILTISIYMSVGNPARMLSYLNLFFLGAGFMLLETRSITSIALFFGSTWIVNAIVIGSILVVVFIGNALIMFNRGINKNLCFLGLFAALALGYFVPVQFILEFPYLLRLLFTAVWFGMPILFASLIFSHSFRNVQNTATAFGANLLGVVVGGVLEYSSMVFGLNSLYLLAILLYAFAMFFVRKPVY